MRTSLWSVSALGVLLLGCEATPGAASAPAASVAVHPASPRAEPAPRASATPVEPVPPGLEGCVPAEVRAGVEACPPLQARVGTAARSAVPSGRLGGRHRTGRAESGAHGASAEARSRYAAADALYQAKDWARCGAAFEAAVGAEPEGPLAAEAAYAAVLCHQNTQFAGHGPRSVRLERGRPDRTPLELDVAAVSMLGAFGRYLCTIRAGTRGGEAEEQRTDVAYARARLWFAANHWEEAAVAFRRLAFESASSEVAPYAAQLYLEAMEILAAELSPPRPACRQSQRADVPRFLARWCSPATADRSDLCAALARMRDELARQAAVAR